MGGKVSSPKCQSLYKYGGHAGAVVLENNYALKQDTMDRPAYVMGYVNTFAVEKYQSNDTEDGLPSENYEEDEVFVSNSKFQTSHSLDSCVSHTDNSDYLLIDSPEHSTPYSVSSKYDRLSQERGIVLMNNVLNTNHLKALKSHLHNNNVHISNKSEHYALMQDRQQEHTLHEDVSTMNINQEEYQIRISRST